MEDQPLVSIIIPSFNQEKFLKETLDSVMAQTYSNWECLVVDDGSLDTSIAIIQSYCQEDNRFVLFERTNLTTSKGANACRNIGLSNSKGEYLIFLDSDDLLKDFCLTNRVAYFKKHADCDFLVFQMIMFNEHGCIPGKTITQQSEHYLYEYLSYNVPWQTSCPIIKRAFVVQHLLGFDESFPRLQDPEFFTSVLLIQDVQYKVFSELPADCMYRHMTDRVSNSRNAIKGFSLYIAKFLPLVQARKDATACSEKLMSFYNSTFSSYLRRLHGTDKFEIRQLLIAYTDAVHASGLIGFSQNLNHKLQIYALLFSNIFKNYIIKLIIVLSFFIKLGRFFIHARKTSAFFCFSDIQAIDSSTCINMLKTCGQYNPIVILNNGDPTQVAAFIKYAQVFDFGNYIHNQRLLQTFKRVLNWTLKRKSKAVYVGIASDFYYALLQTMPPAIIKIDILKTDKLQVCEQAVYFSPSMVSKLNFRLVYQENDKAILTALYNRNNIEAVYLQKVLLVEEVTSIKTLIGS